ncbi:MAG: DUF1838 family protein [Candidatus Syntrophosphaera sp.]
MPGYLKTCLTILACFSAALCAAAEWNTYTNQKFSYSLQYPSAWELQTDHESGFFQASFQPPGSALPVSYSVEVEPLSEEERNLDWMEYTLNIQNTLAAQLSLKGHRNIEILSAETDTLDGKVVFRIELRSSQYANPDLRMNIIKLRQGNRHFTLSNVRQAGYDGVDAELEEMLDSFTFLAQSSEYLDDYIRVRADLAGEDTVFHWEGTIYSFIPGEKRRELFAVEGYNIVRAELKGNGYNLLEKEVALFLDHRTHNVLDSWQNLITNRQVDVVHVFNDPSNLDLGFTEEMTPLLPLILPSSDLGDRIVYYADAFPYYANPLPRREFPLNSQSDIFQAAEFTQYTVDEEDLGNPDLSSVPAILTFTKIQPWLPFMEMGNTPGNVIWSCRGRKLEGGFDALPQDMKERVLATDPGFAHAPRVWTEPNETLWTDFRELSEQSQEPSIPEE